MAQVQLIMGPVGAGKSAFEQLIGVGTKVVLESGLIQQREREEFYARVDQERMGLRGLLPSARGEPAQGS